MVEVLLSQSSAAAFGQAFGHLAYLNTFEPLWALDQKILPKKQARRCEMYVGMEASLHSTHEDF